MALQWFRGTPGAQCVSMLGDANSQPRVTSRVDGGKAERYPEIMKLKFIFNIKSV